MTQMTGPAVSADIGSIQTRALRLDRARRDANIARRAARAAAQGVRFRPHLKTARCAEGARRLYSEGTGPIAVSTVAEVQFLYSHGFTDILAAGPAAADKLERLTPLLGRGLRLQVLTDTLEGAQGPARFGKGPVLLEVDVDGHRGGLAPDHPQLLDAARVLAGAGALGGLLAHAGPNYDGRSSAEAARASALECDGIRRAADRLNDAGLAVRCVSVGSTPTRLHGDEYRGIDEVRAGRTERRRDRGAHHTPCAGIAGRLALHPARRHSARQPSPRDGTTAASHKGGA